MNRKFAVVSLAVVCAALAAPAALRAQDVQDLNIQLAHTPLRGPVHMMTATERRGGGNLTFSAGPDGILLVDAFTRDWAAKLRPALDAVSTAPVKYIVNTHWHGDHIGGNHLLGADATVLARPQVKAKMVVEIHPPWSQRPTPPAPAHAWPDVTFEHPMSIHFNGEEIRLIPFPRSHTDGDTVVYFTQSKVLSMGDTIYTVRGNLGPASDDWSGGDLQSLARNLGALLPQIAEGAKVVPGHGPVLALSDLRAYHQIMLASLDTVRKGLAAGKSLETMVKEGLPQGLPTSALWKINPAPWIETAHESLMRK